MNFRDEQGRAMRQPVAMLGERTSKSMTQKGMESTLLALILAATVLVIVILIFQSVREWLLDHPGQDMSCRLQVAQHAMRVEASKGKYGSPIVCPTDYEIIPPGMTDEQVRALIADKMRTCWDDWGKGEYLLYDEDGVYCHICSFLTFEEDKGKVPGMSKYLIQTTVPGMHKKYVEYFAPGYEGPEFADQLQPPTQGDEIIKSQDYAVIFYYLRGEETYKDWFDKLSKDAVERPVGAAVGAVLLGGASGALVAASTSFFFGCGLLTGGLCWIATAAVAGVTITGSVTGGFIGDSLVNDPPNFASFVMLRPLDYNNVKSLGCQYSFAARK